MPTYKCPKCDKAFNHKTKFTNHLKRKYPCDRNVVLLEAKDQFKCRICKKTYSRKDNLLRHKRTTHGIESRPKKEFVQKSYNEVNIEANFSDFVRNSPQSKFSNSRKSDRDPDSDVFFDDIMSDLPHKSNERDDNAINLGRECNQITCIPECTYCGNNFSSKYTLNRHLKRCPVKLAVVNGRALVPQRELLAKTTEQTAPINVLNNNSNNTYNNQINLTIVPFNEENLERMSEKQCIRFIKNGNMCVPRMIEYINHSPELQRYHNMYMYTTNSVQVKIYDGEEMITRLFNEVFDELYTTRRHFLIDKFEEFRENKDIFEKFTPHQIEVFENFIAGPDKKVMNIIKQETKKTMTDKLNIPKGTWNKINNDEIVLDKYEYEPPPLVE